MQLGALYLPLVLLFVFLLLQIFGTTFPVCKVLSSFLVKSLQPVQFWPEQAYVLHFLHRSIFLLCTNILQYLTYGYIRIQQSFQFVQFTIFSTSCLAFFAPNTVFLSAVFCRGSRVATGEAGNTSTCQNTGRAIQPGSNQSCKFIFLFLLIWYLGFEM